MKCFLLFSLFLGYALSANILALFIPFRGDFNPTYRLCQELSRRGHNITVAVAEEYAFWNEDPSIHFLGAGSSPLSKTEIENVLQDIAPMSYGPDIMKILEVVKPFTQSAFTHLVPIIRERQKGKEGRFDLILFPSAFPMGYDFAEAVNLPYVLIYSGLLGEPFQTMFTLNPPSPTFPSFLSYHYPNMTFVERIQNTLMTYSIPLLAKLGELEKNSLRQQVGLEPYSFFGMKHKLPLTVISVSAFGFEYPMLTSPLVNLVGPFFPKVYPSISDELSSWLDNSDRKVIFATLGTAVYFGKEKMEEFLQAFEDMTEFNVLWLLRKEVRDYIPKDRRIAPHIRIENWVAQISVLKHPKISLYVTVGGFGSLTEGIVFAQVPVLCVAVICEQYENCRRLQYYGAGLALNKFEMTKERIVSSLNTLNSNPSFKNKVQSLSTILLNAGGIERGGDLVESALLIGSNDHLIFKDLHSPWYSKNNWDVEFFLLSMLTLFLYFVCRTLMACFFKKISKKTDNTLEKKF